MRNFKTATRQLFTMKWVSYLSWVSVFTIIATIFILVPKLIQDFNSTTLVTFAVVTLFFAVTLVALFFYTQKTAKKQSEFSSRIYENYRYSFGMPSLSFSSKSEKENAAIFKRHMKYSPISPFSFVPRELVLHGDAGEVRLSKVAELKNYLEELLKKELPTVAETHSYVLFFEPLDAGTVKINLRDNEENSEEIKDNNTALSIMNMLRSNLIISESHHSYSFSSIVCTVDPISFSVDLHESLGSRPMQRLEEALENFFKTGFEVSQDGPTLTIKEVSKSDKNNKMKMEQFVKRAWKDATSKVGIYESGFSIALVSSGFDIIYQMIPYGEIEEAFPRLIKNLNTAMRRNWRIENLLLSEGRIEVRG